MCKMMSHCATVYTYTQAHSGTRGESLHHYQCLSVTIANEGVLINVQSAGSGRDRFCNNAGMFASNVRGCMNEYAR